MRIKALLLVLISLALVLPAAASGPPAEEVLEQADRARFIDADSYVIELKVTAERPDQEPREALLKVYIKRFEDGIRQRVEFLEPEEMRDTVYLVVGDDIYFYQFGHGLREPLRISGQQKLFGDAGVAEAAGISFAEDYQVTSQEETELEGKPALLLHLSSETAAYRLVDLWLEPKTLRPLQAVLYALSEQPLRRVLYKEYAALEGNGNEDENEDKDEYIKLMVVENLLQQGYRTTLEVTEVSVQDLPDELFDPAALHD